MKKLDYLAPETRLFILETELNLCVSGSKTPDQAYFEDFDDLDDVFDMFNN